MELLQVPVYPVYRSAKYPAKHSQMFILEISDTLGAIGTTWFQPHRKKATSQFPIAASNNPRLSSIRLTGGRPNSPRRPMRPQMTLQIPFGGDVVIQNHCEKVSNKPDRIRFNPTVFGAFAK
jgi:hypothetical protein